MKKLTDYFGAFLRRSIPSFKPTAMNRIMRKIIYFVGSLKIRLSPITHITEIAILGKVLFIKSIINKPTRSMIAPGIGVMPTATPNAVAAPRPPRNFSHGGSI